MKIHELEQLTGLDRATIRYYEKEGLIVPERLENGYRAYSEADLKQLLKIKLLRQLELPLDTIKQLQQGSVDFSQVLQHQAKALSEKITTMERAAEICHEISETAMTYQTLDAKQYLERMRQPVQNQVAPQPTEATSVTREYHPVRRLVARFLDYTLLSLALRFIFFVILRVRLYSDELGAVISYGVPFLAVPLMAWAESKFGTTFGKRLMGIRLEQYSGTCLSMADAMEREWKALRYGYGFGIPFWRIWRMYRSYKDYGNGYVLQHDDRIEHVYTAWNVKKKAVFAAICAFIVLLNAIIAFDLMKPKYRENDLTIAHFAENFNYYMSVFDEDSSLRMEPDGSWQYRSSTSTGIVINMNGTAERKNATFDFDTVGEKVTRISYYNTWNDFIICSPISNKLVVASITAVMSQEGMDVRDMLLFAQALEDNASLPDGEVKYENITVRWNTESVGCKLSGLKYVSADSVEPSSVTLHFEIVIS